MNSARGKLIEELMRVGRLIDPAPHSKSLKDKNDPKHGSDPAVCDSDKELEGIPVVENIVNQPYATKDMFSIDDSLELTTRNTEIVDGTTDSDHTLSGIVADGTISDNEGSSQSVSSEEFPITELARELVVLIEDKVSKRSGESLDDAFRDELTEAVTIQLESWLRYN